MLKNVFCKTLVICLLVSFKLHAESDIKNIGDYQFSKKPTVKKTGVGFSISFTVKEACDATVCIVGSDKKVIRHIASGLLGKNAPEPFKKNALSQTISWDGKNDRGRLLDDYSSLSVRVSLGLKAQFERTLYWSPHKRTRSAKYRERVPKMVASSEGVYVVDGGTGHRVTLYDHQGNYKKTVFPVPANKLKKLKGPKGKTFPQDGKSLLVKEGKYFNALLTSGDPESLAVVKNKLYIAGTSFNILPLDGKSDNELFGPEIWKSVKLGRVHSYAGGVEKLPVTSMAASKDGKWIYLSGYYFAINGWHVGGLNGVARISTAKGSKPEPFAGTLVQPNRKITPSKKPGEFNGVTGVAVDSKGRVYIGDYFNNRVQIFDDKGKHLKNISVKRPSSISVNPKNGEIYIFSYTVALMSVYLSGSTVKSMFYRFGNFENPKLKVSIPFRMDSYPVNRTFGGRCTVDFWGKEPVIWVSNPGGKGGGSEKDSNIKLYVEKKGKLVLLKDFHKEAKTKVDLTRGTRHGKQRLYFDYKNETLYASELWGPSPLHCTSMADSAKINPDTGTVKQIFLPFDAEDMAFDINGLAYLRTQNRIGRFETKTWKEVPFDYGAEYKGMSTYNIRKRDMISAIAYNGYFESSSQLGGMAISPKGHIVITAYNPTKASARNKGGAQGLNLSPYKPSMYPGRASHWNLHVWDEHGKILYKDAVAGLGRPVGVRMDAQDNLYIMQAGQGYLNGKVYDNKVSCTYVKTKVKTKFLSTKAEIALPANMKPKRKPDVIRCDFAGDMWLEGAEWTIGGVAIDGKRNKCHCASQSRPALDLYARSFLPEPDRYSVLVVDSNGNKILRLGKYGNVDDGMPLIKDGGPPNPNSIGGDEVAIFHNQFLAVQSDRRLFVGDLGNSRILSVKLDYHKSEFVKLK